MSGACCEERGSLCKITANQEEIGEVGRGPDALKRVGQASQQGTLYSLARSAMNQLLVV